MKRLFITYIHMYIFICRRIREIRQMRLLTEEIPQKQVKKKQMAKETETKGFPS